MLAVLSTHCQVFASAVSSSCLLPYIKPCALLEAQLKTHKPPISFAPSRYPVHLRRSGPQAPKALHRVVHGPFHHIHPIPAPSIPFHPFEKSPQGGGELNSRVPGVETILLSSGPSLMKGKRSNIVPGAPSAQTPPLKSRHPQVSKAPALLTAHPSQTQEVTCGSGHQLQGEQLASVSSGERRKVNGHRVPKMRSHG